MAASEGPGRENTKNGFDRREFLRVGSLSAGALGLSLADGIRKNVNAAAASRDVNCILLFLVGGPSHLDTFDLKPHAPDSIRGPFRPIKTTVPGFDICEHFPEIAKVARHVALVRSVHHLEAPIHETGHQLMQTGRLFRAGREFPHYGAVVSYVKGYREIGKPPAVIIPGPIENTGVSMNHGQTAAGLAAKHQPVFLSLPGRANATTVILDDSSIQACVGQAIDCGPKKFGAKLSLVVSEAVNRGYGPSLFGQSCLWARMLIERQARVVTVNMFDTVFNKVTWDCHADGGSLATNLNDYRNTLCPMFDRAYSTLLNELSERGLLDTTLVVAMGEFGRTPRINSRGGRDHWPGCWTILMAGGGIRGGQVVGSSDSIGSEPRDRPVTPAEVAATIYKSLDIDPHTSIQDEQGVQHLVEAEPVEELF